MTTPPRAFEYQGRMIYPLADLDLIRCPQCVAGGNSTATCADIRLKLDSARCSSAEFGAVYWAEGETAQLQYIKEKLTK